MRKAVSLCKADMGGAPYKEWGGELEETDAHIWWWDHPLEIFRLKIAKLVNKSRMPTVSLYLSCLRNHHLQLVEVSHLDPVRQPWTEHVASLKMFTKENPGRQSQVKSTLIYVNVKRLSGDAKSCPPPLLSFCRCNLSGSSSWLLLLQLLLLLFQEENILLALLWTDIIKIALSL